MYLQCLWFCLGCQFFCFLLFLLLLLLLVFGRNLQISSSEPFYIVVPNSSPIWTLYFNCNICFGLLLFFVSLGRPTKVGTNKKCQGNHFYYCINKKHQTFTQPEHEDEYTCLADSTITANYPNKNSVNDVCNEEQNYSSFLTRLWYKEKPIHRETWSTRQHLFMEQNGLLEGEIVTLKYVFAILQSKVGAFGGFSQLLLWEETIVEISLWNGIETDLNVKGNCK